MSNLFNKVKQKKEVMFCNPEDLRFVDLTVERETENLVYCKKYQNILYKFFKLGPAWTGKVIRFIGVEGHPLVNYISGKDKDGNYLTATMALEDFLKLIWGDKGYLGLPSALKQLVEHPPIGTTVAIKPYIPDEDTQKVFDILKADAALYDSDVSNVAQLGTATETKKWADKAMDKLPWIFFGFGLTYVLQGLGVIH